MVLKMVLFAPLGCATERSGDPDDSVGPVIDRDSAGVHIVENLAPVWADGEGWSLSRQPTFEVRSALIDEASPVSEPMSAYERSDGLYVVADGGNAGAQDIVVLDASGDMLLSFGGEGEGPGEFRQLWWARAYRGDSIAAYDVVGHRMSVFAGDGSFGRSVRLPDPPPPESAASGGTVPWAYGVYPDGSFLASPVGKLDVAEGPGIRWFRHLILRVAPDARSWDTLGVFPAAQMRWSGEDPEVVPFERVGYRDLHGDELYFATGETYEILVYDRSGGLARIIRRSAEPKPVTAADMEEYRQWFVDLYRSGPEGGEAAYERAREQARRLRPPETKPALSNLLIDELGNLWVEEYRWLPEVMPPHPRPTEWSVFDPAGRWLGDVSVPARVLLKWVGADEVLAVYMDRVGVSHLRAYRIEKTE